MARRVLPLLRVVNAFQLSGPNRSFQFGLTCRHAQEEAMLSGFRPGTTQYCRRNGQIWRPDAGEALPEVELLTAPTPNGHKVSIFLEELGVPYRVRCIDLGGEQFSPEFLVHNPNGKIPALFDHALSHSVFESGAILLYLAEKFSDQGGAQFLPQEFLQRSKVEQWLMWQMANLGPMVGQAITFNRFVKEKVPYAIERYGSESRRLYEVLDNQLRDGRPFLCGDLSIADFACFPWVRAHRMAKVRIDGLSNLEAWLARLKQRAGVRCGLSVGFPDSALGREMGERYANDKTMTEEQKRAFMQSGNDMLHEKADSLRDQQN